jgi:RNA polymerase subunit RPABC4/transcription elongation factor Spt4
MKNCSYCGRENDDSAVVCRECGTEFDTSPPAAPVDPQLEDLSLSLVIAATFSNVVDASLFKTRLEAAGIEACIPEELTPQILWSVIPSPLERVTVRVAAKDYDAARALFTENIDASTTAVPPRPADLDGHNSSDDDDVVEEETDAVQNRKQCVACDAVILGNARLCPKCGWTQAGA